MISGSYGPQVAFRRLAALIQNMPPLLEDPDLR